MSAEFVARVGGPCYECGNPVPTADEREKLASMRNELLEDDWAYWHDDPAILFLNRMLGDEFPPFCPPHMTALDDGTWVPK